MKKRNIVKLMDAYSNLRLKFKDDDEKCEQAYEIFAQEIINRIAANPAFSFNIFESAFNYYFKIYNYKRKNDENDVKNLIEYIKKCFEINTGVHFVVISMQCSTVSKTIKIDDELFIVKQDDDVSKMYTDISIFTEIKLTDVQRMLEHTQKSRAKDFMKSNLIIYKVSDQTDNVNIGIAERLIYSLQLVHQYYEIKESAFITHKGNPLETCNHIAILSLDDWRWGHGYRYNFCCEIRYDLKFLNDSKVIDDYNIIKNLLLKKNKDDLEWVIADSIYMFGKAEYERTYLRDSKLAFILYFISLEHLISEDYSSKRLCLSKVISELIGDKKNKLEIEKTVCELYKLRNQFIHTGENICLYYDNKDLCEKLSIMTAKVLMCAINHKTQHGLTLDSWKKKINLIYNERKDSWIKRFISKYIKKRDL